MISNGESPSADESSFAIFLSCSSIALVSPASISFSVAVVAPAGFSVSFSASSCERPCALSISNAFWRRSSNSPSFWSSSALAKSANSWFIALTMASKSRLGPKDFCRSSFCLSVRCSSPSFMRAFSEPVILKKATIYVNISANFLNMVFHFRINYYLKVKLNTSLQAH